MAASDGEGVSGCEGRGRREQSSVRVVSEALQVVVLWNQTSIRIRRMLSGFEKTNDCNFVVLRCCDCANMLSLVVDAFFRSIGKTKRLRLAVVQIKYSNS